MFEKPAKPLQIDFTHNLRSLCGLILLATLVIACGKTPEPGEDFTENYKSGKLYKECKSVEQIDSMRYLYRCTAYYEKGGKRSEGNYINGVTPIGWHKIYRPGGTVKREEEWWRTDSSRISLNRVIAYNMKGNIDKKESNYYIIRNLDSANRTLPTARIEFTLAAPYFPKSRVTLFVRSNTDTMEQIYSQTDYTIAKTFMKPVSGPLHLNGKLMELMEIDRSGDSTTMQQRILYFDVVF